MNIRKKTKTELSRDKKVTKNNIEVGVITSDILGILTQDNYVDYLRKSKRINKQREINEKNGVLTLRAVVNEFRTFNVNTGVYNNIPATIIEAIDYKAWLHLHQNIKHCKINDLKIFSHRDNVDYELPIPLNDRKNIINYLINGQPFETYDCRHFLHDAKGMNSVTNENGAALDLLEWIFEIKDPSELRPGECIMLLTELSGSFHDNIKHYAYYLGNGLYISKFGCDGGICITSLEKMHKYWGTKEFLCMKPNTASELDEPTRE